MVGEARKILNKCAAHRDPDDRRHEIRSSFRDGKNRNLKRRRSQAQAVRLVGFAWFVGEATEGEKGE